VVLVCTVSVMLMRCWMWLRRRGERLRQREQINGKESSGITLIRRHRHRLRRPPATAIEWTGEIAIADGRFPMSAANMPARPIRVIDASGKNRHLQAWQSPMPIIGAHGSADAFLLDAGRREFVRSASSHFLHDAAFRGRRLPCRQDARARCAMASPPLLRHGITTVLAFAPRSP